MKSPDSLTEALAEAHNAVNARHAESRARLLADLPPIDSASPRRQWIVGGVGAAAACLLIAVVGLVATPKPSSAMERMARAMEKVSSFAWRMEIVNTSLQGEGRTVRHVVIGQWCDQPMSLRASHKVWETQKSNTAVFSPPKMLVDIEETHQAGRRGILVNFLKREFHWIDGSIDATTVPGDSPQVLIFKVRQQRGRVLRDLGVKPINGVEARGVELLLDDGWPASERGPVTAGEGEHPEHPSWGWRNARVEAWFDPATNLPIEFESVRRGEGYEERARITDLRWNLAFDADHFVAKPPQGYTEKVLTADESE